MGYWGGQDGDDTITPGFISEWVLPPFSGFPSAGLDRLSGKGGDDYLDGGGGADTLRGEEGNDTLVVRQGGEFSGGTGDDLMLVVSAGAGTVIAGGLGNDSLDAQTAVDITGASLVSLEYLLLDSFDLTLTGAQLDSFGVTAADGSATTGQLVLSGGGAAQTDLRGLLVLNITGSSADERLLFTTSTSTNTRINVDGGLGNDSIVAAEGNDTLVGGFGLDTLVGGAGADRLTGDDANDRLAGGTGSDTLDGGAGVDVIAGDSGSDRLTGGSGPDRFHYAFASEGTDTITDFVRGSDLIEIDASGFGGGLVAGASLPAARLVVHASSLATAPAGTGQFIFNTVTDRLSWDVDGAGGASAVTIAVLTGQVTFATSDFALI
ncbi:calcium-binding protein [Roseomonas sp. CECT 9278]|uniref:calcium-binding protein n=1 Tax=Roseomonas sp. CECT 9278 TaxID=2845823 RepID=UPI001E3AD9C2|nr:calcium-binding protein [Roseomonas sp. CECT 9278]CAH0285835.1 hypothetical protein ROS9278_04078 [Roseomonas sp. CECT 9278]